MLGFAPIGGAPIGGALFSGGGGGGGGGPDVELIEGFRWIDDSAASRAYQGIVDDVLNIEPVILLHHGVVVTERLGIGGVLKPGQLLGTRLADTVGMYEALRLGFSASLTESLAISLTQAQQRAALILEQFQLAQITSPGAIFGVRVTEQLIRLRDTLAKFMGADIVEGLALMPTLVGQAHLAGRLLDGIEIEAVLEPQFIFTAVLDEGVEVEAEQLITMLFQPELIDGIELSAGYLSPGGDYTAWAMNARTGAVSEYTNYAFNSFAQVGGRYVGASDSGLYDLSGDKDDGEDIIARLRSGYMQFGGTHLSRLKAAYIAARGEGEFILRIETADGLRYDYQTSTRNMRTTKISMGKGQRARYFAFELISAGQDFDLDTLEFVPIVVQRRV